MSRRNPGLRAVGPCLIVAIALLSIAATSARAEGNFWIEGSPISSAEIESEEDKAFTLVVPKESIKIPCAKSKLDLGLIFLAGGSSGQLLFTGCSVISTKTGEPVPFCTVDDISASIKDELFLHNGGTYDLIKPASGTTFATIKILGPEKETEKEKCILPKELPVAGTFVFEDAAGEFEKETVSHLVQPASESLFKAQMEKNELTLSGGLRLKLKGANAGKAWKGSAAALKGGDFRIEGTSIGKTVEVEAEEDKTFTLLWSSFNFEITCSKFILDDGLLFVKGGSLGTLLFQKCAAFTMSPKLEEITGCTVGNIEAKVKGTLLTHGGKAYEVLEPDTGLAFTVFNISGGECALPKTVEVRGSLVLEDSGGFEKEVEKHLVQQASAALFPCYTLKVGTNELRLDGSAWLKLSGENKGKPWGGFLL